MPERILVVNAYGDVVKDAKVISYGDKTPKRKVLAPGYITRIIYITRRTKRIMLVIAPGTAKGPELESACEMNLACAAEWAAMGGGNLKERFLDKVVKAEKDRTYVSVRHGETLAKTLDRSGAWRSVSGRMHKPHEDGFEIVGSWKTNRKAPDLQVTLWRRPMLLDGRGDGRPGPVLRGESYVAELDIDLRSGKGHIFEVAKNKLTGSTTHPYLVNQALGLWGVISFRLEPGDSK